MNTMKLQLPGDGDPLMQEAFKILRTNLQFSGSDIKVVELTAYGENEGKSVISLKLAQSLAELGKRVLLIDADLRKSVMAGRNTTAKPQGGLSEVLVGIAPYEEYLWEAEGAPFHVLFAGKYPPNPVELLNSHSFEKLVAEVREKYDYVIVDTPPLGMVIDAAVIAPKCDGCAIVIGDDKLKYRQLEAMVNQIRKSDCKLLGVIRNRPLRQNHSGYYYAGKKKSAKESES